MGRSDVRSVPFIFLYMETLQQSTERKGVQAQRRWLRPLSLSTPSFRLAIPPRRICAFFIFVFGVGDASVVDGADPGKDGFFDRAQLGERQRALIELTVEQTPFGEFVDEAFDLGWCWFVHSPRGALDAVREHENGCFFGLWAWTGISELNLLNRFLVARFFGSLLGDPVEVLDKRCAMV